jgi:PKD domain
MSLFSLAVFPSLTSSTSTRFTTLRRRAALVLCASVMALSACGGSDDEPAPVAVDPPVVVPPVVPPVLPPVVANQPPVAEFTAAATVVAGQALAVNGSASRDPEGGVITHAWAYGDGQLGGAAQMAHIYSVPGTYAAVGRVGGCRGQQCKRCRF